MNDIRDTIRQARVVWLGAIDSTNTEAMRRIAAGETGPLWICAASQTAGKGRAGRSWVSASGNFYGSLILPLDCPRAAVPGLSLLVGVAVHDAILQAAGRPLPGLRLKWPNDVLVGTAKLAGILPESTTLPDGRLVAILGIGINLANPPTHAGRPVAGLCAPDVPLDPAALVAPLGHWLGHWIGLWSGGAAFDRVRDAWLVRAGHVGEAIRVNSGTGPIGGSFMGLDHDGALLMQMLDGAIRRVTFGDVMLAGE